MVIPRDDGWSVARPGDRNRLRAAYERRFTGEVPFFECYVAPEIIDCIMGRPVGVAMPKLPPGLYVEFLQRTGMDAAYLYEGWFLGRKTHTDRQGRVHYVDGTIKTRDDFVQIQPPSLDPIRQRIESFLDAAQDTDLGAIYSIDTSASIMQTAIGPIDSLTLLYDDPDMIREFCDQVDEFVVRVTETVLEYPLDAIWISGLRCANAGPMVSPSMHEEFIFPRLELVMDVVRPSGIPVVLHTDGDNSVFMDWIVDTGFAAIHPVEPGIGGFDIYELKTKYGNRICLQGNIDVASVLVRGSAADVQQDVIDHISRLAPGGGYVCGSSHDISENIPFENFCALAETVCSTQADGDALRIERVT